MEKKSYHAQHDFNPAKRGCRRTILIIVIILIGLGMILPFFTRIWR